jgi:hypothetical protein
VLILRFDIIVYWSINRVTDTVETLEKTTSYCVSAPWKSIRVDLVIKNEPKKKAVRVIEMRRYINITLEYFLLV